MRWIAVLLGILLLVGGAAAAEPQLGPIIKGYGPAYAVPELDVPLPGDTVEKLDMAVVLHGQALLGALSENAYAARFDSPNPNLELLAALSDAGVKFYACGQSMAHRKIEAAQLAEPVKVALSAMTMLTLLQARGYALIPWWG